MSSAPSTVQNIQPVDGDDAQSPRKRRGFKPKRLIPLVILMAAIGTGGYFGYNWWTNGRFVESTDDAYVAADMTLMSAKVSGYVQSVSVQENQYIQAGAEIARIDDADYRLAVQAAQDRIVSQKAAIDRIAVQVEAAKTDIEEAEANLASSQAELNRATRAFERQSKLSKGDYVTAQAVDDARADRDKARAAVSANIAAVNSAKADVQVLDAQRAEAESEMESLLTALSQAERDLSFTVVRAPVSGLVGNKSVEVGQLVQQGSRLMAIVPIQDVYIEANFKETQLAHLEPGQKVTIAVDAYPENDWTGIVESLSPASGALFSLLPPENATGNFTKIVQRLPVRISVEAPHAGRAVLRPGMSVVVSIDTRQQPALAQTDTWK
ncbi:HlyD family secretion protein [Rhodospirillaceae bacterium KN72]|uniref:HlyD family secretion protein n=1 Tax=Pacificispira spongiicola TaxID=2729598 RepID=A0A7Y0E385_9PROT|nr:HlyD family secretion protein [Pacificispira spongiicola]NMM46422.1 HlyD family secretion protein [Pacificispira spongiicola]